MVKRRRGKKRNTRVDVDNDADDEREEEVEENAKDTIKSPRLLLKFQGETSLKDISLEVGRPYLFVHGHDWFCEHYITITDLRFFHRSGHLFYSYFYILIMILFFQYVEFPYRGFDLSQKSSYPRVVHKSKMKRRICEVCQFESAALVCYGDRFCPENPVLLCNSCHKMMHFSPEDELLYNDFQTFPYHHDLV